jgi:drug/metabolite transporter (DMT)-like permease
MTAQQLLDQESPAQTTRPGLAIAILGLCCLFWGFSFPAMQITAAHFERLLGRLAITVTGASGELATRATFNGWRFALATAAYLLITFPRQRNFSRDDMLGGLIVGLCFCMGILCQLIGLRYTLPSTSSFLTALSVVFAPLAQALLLRRPVNLTTILAVMTAVIGMLVLNQSNPDAHTSETIAQKPPIPHLGEILTIIGSLLFTFQILAIDHWGKSADATRLTFIMLATCCLVSLLVGLTLGGWRFQRADIFSLLIRDRTFILCFVGLALISSAIAQHLMNKYQPLVSPATASVVYCLEPLFGTLFSVAFGTERLSTITILGGSIILLAVLLVARSSAPKQNA